MVKTKTQKRIEEDEDPLAFLADDDPEEDEISYDRDGFPSTVPVLDRDDICTNFKSNGRRDLLVWLSDVFDIKAAYTKAYQKAKETLCGVIAERLELKGLKCLWLFIEHAHKNKAPSRRWQATAWNEAMRRLGYEIEKEKCREPKK